MRHFARVNDPLSLVHALKLAQTPKVALTIIAMISATSFFGLIASAENANAQAQPSAAVRDTQALLQDQKRLEREALTNESAKRAHESAKSLMGGNQEDLSALYGLSADIFGKLAKDAADDPVKMQEIINAALKDPGAFAAKLDPQQLAKLKELARKVEARQPAHSPSK